MVSSLTPAVFKQKLGSHAPFAEYISNGTSNTGVRDWVNHNTKYIRVLPIWQGP